MKAYIDIEKRNGFICDDDGGMLATMGRFYTYAASYGPGIAEDEDLIECSPEEVKFDHRFDVRFIRESTGMTQKAFSEKFSIPLRTLQSWEDGERTPALYIVKMLDELNK